MIFSLERTKFRAERSAGSPKEVTQEAVVLKEGEEGLNNLGDVACRLTLDAAISLELVEVEDALRLNKIEISGFTSSSISAKRSYYQPVYSFSPRRDARRMPKHCPT
jgi:hypothetical protein